MSLEEGNCIYCNSKAAEFQFELRDIFEDNYKLLKCNACQTRFLSPPPSDEQLIQAYGRDYYGEGDQKFNKLTQYILDALKKRSSHYFTKHLRENDKILDIGCGDGSFLMALKQRKNLELFGLEIEGESANRARTKKAINLKISEFKEEIYDADLFDAISIIHVFEHLPQPRMALKEIHRILKRDGIFFIEIPNIESWQAKLFGKNWLHLDPPRHLNMMSPNTLIKELENIGFQVIDSKHSSIQFGPYGAQQSTLNALGFKRDLLYEYLKDNKKYCENSSVAKLKLMQTFHWLTFPFFVFTDFLASRFKRGAIILLTLKKMH